MRHLSTLPLTLGTLVLASLSFSAGAQDPAPVHTPAPAASVATAAGVALSDLAENAPERYTIRSGDTLWALSQMFLKSPWRWPELWGMNKTEIANPNRIYPGQVLELVHSNGNVHVRLAGNAQRNAPPETIRLSPRTRQEALSDLALPTLRPNIIEPFLVEPMVVDAATLNDAARIVAGPDSRVLMTRGDRMYARSAGSGSMLDGATTNKPYRIFRNATPLKDPASGAVLGYEAQYIGKAVLVHGESSTEVSDKDRKKQTALVPATLDIILAKEEIRVGDRLLPEPERQWLTYTPHAPAVKVDGRIVSVYGTAVANAAQNQVVAINLGTNHGMESGHVLSIQKDGATLTDKSDPTRPLMKLPDEHNGLMMVFRTFDNISYALVLEITHPVRIGDRLTNPR